MDQRIDIEQCFEGYSGASSRVQYTAIRSLRETAACPVSDPNGKISPRSPGLGARVPDYLIYYRVFIGWYSIRPVVPHHTRSTNKREKDQCTWYFGPVPLAPVISSTSYLVWGTQTSCPFLKGSIIRHFFPLNSSLPPAHIRYHRQTPISFSR